jgi:hypothetical protein
MSTRARTPGPGGALRTYIAAVGAGIDPDAAVSALVAPYLEPDGARTIPAPMSFGELLTVADPEERDLANGIIPADANILICAYPKSYKTFVVLELAVALVTATPFLGRFTVPRQHRVGVVLMEDAKHRVRRRLERMCMARGVTPADVADRLHLWFRPPLQLADPQAIADMQAYAAELRLDLLELDNWSYVASGDSNSADEVTQQLGPFASIRDARPGMSVLLVQHARKQAKDASGERLTDMIRNSSAFGAWYDSGLVLSRQDEHAPVSVRVEMRDRPAPQAFAFTVEDEVPGDDLRMPSGYLRLQATDKTPKQMQQESAGVRLAPDIEAFLLANPGCSKKRLEDAITGERATIRAAFDWMCASGSARFDAPDGPGKAGRCWLVSPTSPDLAGTSPRRTQGDLADLAAAPVGGEAAANPLSDSGATSPARGAQSEGYYCGGCGREVGGPRVTCIGCKATREVA